MSCISKMRRPILSLMAIAQLVLPVPGVFADGGDFQFDFIASAPFTYSHVTGGGAYDNRTIGKTLDVVESLEGGDFACGDRVSFLVQIRVDAGAVGAQTVELDFGWTADSTGQSGAAFDVVQSSGINYGVIAGGQGEGAGGTDSGISDDLGSVATVVATNYAAVLHTQGAERGATIRVTDLEPGETVVLRFELGIDCNGETPTGNLQAYLLGARVVAPASEVSNASAGNQTIPLKRVGNIVPPPPCDPKIEECPPPPK